MIHFSDRVWLHTSLHFLYNSFQPIPLHLIWWGHNLPLLLLVGIGLFNLLNTEGTIAFPAPGSYILYSTEMPLVFQIWVGKQ